MVWRQLQCVLSYNYRAILCTQMQRCRDRTRHDPLQLAAGSCVTGGRCHHCVCASVCLSLCVCVSQEVGVSIVVCVSLSPSLSPSLPLARSLSRVRVISLSLFVCLSCYGVCVFVYVRACLCFCVYGIQLYIFTSRVTSSHTQIWYTHTYVCT